MDDLITPPSILATYETDSQFFVYEREDARNFCRAYMCGVACGYIETSNNNEQIRSL